MTTSRQEQDLQALQAANRVLQEENSQLLERAEDAMLLALVAEALDGCDNFVQVVDRVLERIAILKDLPYASCGQLTGTLVAPLGTYSSFSDDKTAGYPVSFSPEVVGDLGQGPCLAEVESGVSMTLPPSKEQPDQLLIIPFHSREVEKGVFLFFDRPDQYNRLPGMVFLIEQVVRLAVSRLDNLFLSRQLEQLNQQLEERIERKTRDLQLANIRLSEMYDGFLTILQGLESAITVIDTKSYRILFANQSARAYFGENLEGRLCYQAIRGVEEPCDICKIPELLSAPNEMRKTAAWESYNPATGRWFLNLERVVDWPGSLNALLSNSTDITNLKLAEDEKQALAEELHRAQKLEAIGLLAGSVAHDLNNILAGVVSYPDLLLATMPMEPPLRRALMTIQDAGKKGAKIVQDLLLLARRGVQLTEPVELGKVVRDYLESPEYQALLAQNPQLTVITELPDTPLVVLGSPAHLANVLMNLITNGAEAMPGGGRLTISLKRTMIKAKPHGFLNWRPGAYALLLVDDRGEGIATDHLARVFDPFFTQKRGGKSGTGLGLTVVQGTVTDHQGHVAVESNPGKGSRFIVYLPLVDESVLPQGQEGEQLPELARGQGQLVLVVDDEASQRKLASEILMHLGYKVVTAASGDDAVAYLQQHQADLLLLDMLMPPGMDGLQTYELVRELQPELTTILVSGFSQSERVKKALDLGVVHYLQKPYTLAVISEAIKEALLKGCR